MGLTKQRSLEVLILGLFDTQKEINLQQVARLAGMVTANPAHRRSIQRAFKNLIDQKTIESYGNARTRVYRLVQTKQITNPESIAIQGENTEAFQDIPLSHQARALLRYVSQSLKVRNPIGYHQEFLRNYQPNQTFYLSEEQRFELLRVGRVEHKIRPAGTYARNILSRFLIDLSWNSSRLEGNTYSLLETKRLIELGEPASGKEASEAQMVLNHKSAIEYIIDTAEEQAISQHEIYSIHALLSENLLGDPSASGRLRQIAVGISDSTYVPLENFPVLKEYFDLLIEKMNLIKDPFEQSFFSLVQVSYLQAFEDVNKRTARLVANIPFVKKNLKPISFIDVDKEAYVKALLGVYEKNDVALLRDLYLWGYKRSSQRYSAIQQSMGEPNLLKLKYRAVIHDIIRTIVLGKTAGSWVVNRLHGLLRERNIPMADAAELFKVIEMEIASLHNGNIARFRILPSEFQTWQSLQ